MKKYLKTPEEVIDALEAGKAIHSGFNETTSLLKGKYIVRKCSAGDIYFGAQIELNANPYIEVEDPKPALKLEVGKFYKTRDGRKAFLYHKKGYCHFVLVGTDYGFNTSLDGLYYPYKKNHDCDIIAPWEEEHAEND